MSLSMRFQELVYEAWMINLSPLLDHVSGGYLSMYVILNLPVL